MPVRVEIPGRMGPLELPARDLDVARCQTARDQPVHQDVRRLGPPVPDGRRIEIGEQVVDGDRGRRLAAAANHAPERSAVPGPACRIDVDAQPHQLARRHRRPARRIDHGGDRAVPDPAVDAGLGDAEETRGPPARDRAARDGLERGPRLKEIGDLLGGGSAQQALDGNERGERGIAGGGNRRSLSDSEENDRYIHYLRRCSAAADAVDSGSRENPVVPPRVA